MENKPTIIGMTPGLFVTPIGFICVDISPALENFEAETDDLDE
jgi:hypothetical protein